VARETGDIFVWGLNAHGQLGLGDTAKRLSPTLLNVESSVGGPPVQFDDVAAGDNNSMALTRASRTMWAWGSRGRCHAADKHELRPKTVESTAGAGFGVGFVACGAKYTVAFAPTRVRKIVPAAGPTDGGSEISIIVDGVWPSDKILVKFSAILTEEEKGEVSEEDCVEIEAGTFNPDTGAVVCRTPPWPLDEAVLVEISVNGFDFTSDCVTYTFYNPPTVHGAWPPYGFMDVPTPITVYGKSIVSSSDLAVRFRSTLAPTSGNGEDEEEDDGIVDVVVPARYMGQGQVKCVAPIIDSSREVVEVAVDVAINGLDFTDAGVIFTFHGFQPISCNPCCGPRSGGSAVVIPLSPGAGEIDEDALRVKIDFGGTRTVECKAKARGGKLSFKTPKMDGTQRPPKFPSFEYTPVEEDSVVSDASITKKEETLIVDDPPPAPNVEPLPWPKGTGFLEGTIMLSVNAGLTYRTLPFVFTAYKSSPKSLVLSSAVVDSQGGVDLRILDRSLAALEASTSDPGSEEAASAAEASAREDAVTTEEGSGLTTDTEENVTEAAPDAQTSAAAEDETPSDDWSGPSLKARSSEPAGSGPWLFTASETKVRFQGSAPAGDGEEQGGPACSINATVDATFDGEGTITCVVPATPATEAWIKAIKEKREAGEDEDDVQPDPDADDEDGEPSKMPLRPVNFEAQVSLALDGINFEKIGTVTVLSPPLVTGIIGGGPDESFVPGMEARLVGSGFGEVGSTVSVEVSHVLSGLDFTVPGVVESVDGDESPQAAVFTFPEDINSQLVEGDPTACTCNAEISIDGGSKYSSWQTTFTASVMPPAED
jgi:hypothetical protein